MPLKRIAARVGVSVSTVHLWTRDIELSDEQRRRNQVIFANSDRAMVVYFCRFLRACFELGPDDFSLRLNVYTTNGLTLREIEDHWLWALGLPRSCLRKHSLNHTPTSSSGMKRNKLPYGVCTLRVLRSTHIVQHIYGAIQEYAGFEEPRWLDGPPQPSRAGKRRRAA